jgi:hypothetical protein
LAQATAIWWRQFALRHGRAVAGRLGGDRQSSKTEAHAGLIRSHGRCSKGERLQIGFPRGHGQTTTWPARLHMTGMVAQVVLHGPINGDWFEAYVRQVLVPDLKPTECANCFSPCGYCLE